MSNVVRRLLATLMVASVALVGIAASTAPAQAIPPDPPSSDPPCEWAPGQSGTHSECDGLDPAYGGVHYDQCGVINYHTVDVVDIRGGGGVLAQIFLVYSRGERPSTHPAGTCRTAWAAIFQIDDGVNYCRVEVRRNSDQQKYEVYASSEDIPETRVVYDAGVTSYAWGICLYNGTYYTARTINY